MADITKSYLNWPAYDDDLANKAYVDTQVEGIASGDLTVIKKAVKKNTQDIHQQGQSITNIERTKLDTDTYDTFIEKEYTPLAKSVNSTVAQVDVEYYLSDSNLTLTGGSWSTEAPPWVDGKYMWSRQKITYVDGTYNISNTTCIAGATGATGPKGEDGAKGDKGDKGDTGPQGPQGIQGEKGQDGAAGKDGTDGKSAYQEWLDAGNTGTEQDFLDSLIGPQGLRGLQGEKGEQGIQGPQGPKGDTGEQGPQGETGASGKTSYFHIKYSSVANPTSSSQISETPNTYIGTYVDYTEADSTDPSKYTWSRFQGLQGDKGDQGIAGKDGASGKTSYLHIKYSNDGKTFTPNSGEDVGYYIGQYVDFNVNDSTTFSDYKWSKIKGETGATGPKGEIGPQGEKGDTGPQGEQGIQGPKGEQGIQGPQGNTGPTGTGIDSLTEEYAISDSKTTAPTTGWSTTQPSWSDSYYIWTRTKIVYKNPSSTEYTDPVCSTVNDAYNDLALKINGKIESYYQSTDPSTDWSTAAEKETHLGDIWYNTTNQKTFVYYKDSSTSPVTYKWQWQNVPIELIDSVNGKATIYSGVIPTNYKTGDYWIIPTNCFNNIHSISDVSSQTGNYVVGMNLKFGRYTLIVDAVDSNNKITHYTVDVPAQSNYSLAAGITNEGLTLTINSVSNFMVPYNCYGGSICIATSNSTFYSAGDWIPRNDYVPSDLAGRYSLAEDVNNYINELNNNIEGNYSTLDGKINNNYSTLNGKIDDNYSDLDDKINSNYDTFDNQINGSQGVNTKIDNIDTKYDGLITGVKADIQKLQDRLVANIRGTGGNNLLQNSVGFRQKLYWNEVNVNNVVNIEQTYKTYPEQMVTIFFRYKTTDTNNIKVILGKYTGTTFSQISELLNISSHDEEWKDFSYTYTSSINNPVIRFNSTFTGQQDNDAESNGASGSKLIFNNGLVITDLMIGYGEKQPWTPYYNEVYGKTYNLDKYGFDTREAASGKYAHLDANSLDFRTNAGDIESEFSKASTKTDNIYIANSFNIGKLHMVKLDENNIIEYIN